MNSRAAYVAIGVGVNLLMLVRGVVLMTVLGYADLGLVALVQAAMLFFGLMHFGLLNGGYRMLCNAGPLFKQRIVDFAYTGFAVIALLIVAIALVYAVFLDSTLHRFIAGLTALGGICTLLRSWMTNEMVAAGRLKAVNLINGASMLASLAMLVLLVPGLSAVDAALVAVSSVIIQPVLFAALALLSGSVIRPRQLQTSRRLAGVVFGTGFTLFLTGIAIQAGSLMERTYVSSELGLEPLGRLYLAFLFLTLFNLVPTLVQQAFLPNIVKSWKSGDEPVLRKEVRILLAITLGYCTAAALALWLLAEPVLALVLPQYVPDLRWVYLLAPGLIAYALSAPFALIFNVVLEYRWYVVSYGAGVALTVVVFSLALATRQVLTLDQVIVLRSGVYALMAALIMLGWWQVSGGHREFRRLAGIRTTV